MGSGYKNFTAGSVLTAADVNGYLMRQSTMYFATAAARDSALSGVLAEGMLAYQADTDAISYYTGTAWKIIYQPFTVYAPTWSGGITIGNGTWSGNGYTINGGSVTFGGYFTFGTTTTMATSNAPFSLPVTGHASGNSMGVAALFDSSANFFYPANVQYAGGGSTALVQNWSAGASGSFSSTVPFTWAVSDQIRFSITYQQA